MSVSARDRLAGRTQCEQCGTWLDVAATATEDSKISVLGEEPQVPRPRIETPPEIQVQRTGSSVAAG